MIVLYIKQHLSNIWNWIHKKKKTLRQGWKKLRYTAQPILINWNEKDFSKSNILTVDHKLNPENSCTITVRFGTTVVEIKNAVVVVVLIFLKHNGLCGRGISSSQLWQVDSTVDDFHILWPSQKVTHDKIILKVCFDSSVENIFIQSN